MIHARGGLLVWTLRWRVALGTLLLGVLAYLIAWNVDPYVFGVVVLGLGTLQAAVAGLGIIARLTRLDRSDKRDAIVWLVDVLLLATAAAAFAALGSISWN